jgi:hypothetical protein
MSQVHFFLISSHLGTQVEVLTNKTTGKCCMSVPESVSGAETKQLEWQKRTVEKIDFRNRQVTVSAGYVSSSSTRHARGMCHTAARCSTSCATWSNRRQGQRLRSKLTVECSCFIQPAGKEHPRCQPRVGICRSRIYGSSSSNNRALLPLRLRRAAMGACAVHQQQPTQSSHWSEQCVNERHR